MSKCNNVQYKERQIILRRNYYCIYKCKSTNEMKESKSLYKETTIYKCKSINEMTEPLACDCAVMTM